MNGAENNNFNQKAEEKKTDFASFSEGLNKLKLKKNKTGNSNFKATEGTSAIGEKMSELEKLLMQLKNSNLKDDLGTNISVNNNFNININSNINIQSASLENSKVPEKNSNKIISNTHETNNKPPHVEKESTQQLNTEEIPEISLIEIEAVKMTETAEIEKKEKELIYNNNISEIKIEPSLHKQEDNEEDFDIKKFIDNNENQENKPQMQEEDNKIAMVNDILGDDSFFRREKTNEKFEEMKDNKEVNEVFKSLTQKGEIINSGENKEMNQENIIQESKNRKKEGKNNLKVIDLEIIPVANSVNENKDNLKTVNLDFFETDMDQSNREANFQNDIASAADNKNVMKKPEFPNEFPVLNFEIKKTEDHTYDFELFKVALDEELKTKMKSLNNDELLNIIQVQSSSNSYQPPVKQEEKVQPANFNLPDFNVPSANENKEVLNISDIPEVCDIEEINSYSNNNLSNNFNSNLNNNNLNPTHVTNNNTLNNIEKEPIKEKYSINIKATSNNIKTPIDMYFDRNEDSPLISNTHGQNNKYDYDLAFMKTLKEENIIKEEEERANYILNDSTRNHKDVKEKESMAFDPKDIAMLSENNSLQVERKNTEKDAKEDPIDEHVFVVSEQKLTEEEQDIIEDRNCISNGSNNNTINKVKSVNKDPLKKEFTLKEDNNPLLKENTASSKIIINDLSDNKKEQESRLFNMINPVNMINSINMINPEPEVSKVEKKEDFVFANENDFVFEDAVEETPIMSGYAQKTKEIINEKQQEVLPKKAELDTMNAFFGHNQNKKIEQNSKVLPPITQPVNLPVTQQTNLPVENSHATQNLNADAYRRKSNKKEKTIDRNKREELEKLKDEIKIDPEREEESKENEIDILNYNSNNNMLKTFEVDKNEQERLKEQELQNAYYRKLISFEKNEIHYNETVNDFAKIFKEKNYLFLKRRKYLMLNEYYRQYFLKENNIVDRYKKLPHNYTEILEDGLNSFLRESDFHSIFQDVIGHDNNNKAEVLKLLETKNENTYIPLIGKIKPIRTFLDKSNISEKENSEEIIREVFGWREIQCDGDSFYRAFMFGLFEHYILSQNLHEIKKLVLDIYRINKNPGATLFKTRRIDFNIALVIFYLIVEHLTNKHVDKAYDVFLKAYSMEDNSFDLVLIGYIRLILYLNVAELEKQVAKFKRQGTDPNLKRSNTAGISQIEFEEVNTETFLVYQNEPTKLALSLIPLVFNVNVDLFSFDGSINKTKNIVAFVRQKFVFNAVNELPMISICYNLSSYSKFYCKPLYERFSSVLSTHYEPSLTRNGFMGREEDCEKCLKKTKTLLLVKYATSVCSECVKKYVMETMEKRAIIYNKENFINREYYSRFIELKDNIFLEDLDIFLLFGCNISSLLHDFMKKMCFNCDTVIRVQDDLVHLDCTCQLCRECLNKFIYTATNGEMVLNKFEKKNIRQIGCCCNLPFDTENALKVISQTSREYKDKAIKRLENYASSICMKCNNVLVDDGEVFQVQNTKDEYFRLRILFNETTRDPEKEIARVDHLICMKCVDKILKQDAIENNKRKKMGANININPAVKNIQCKICDEEHIIDIKEWNSIFKRNCCNGCFIY